MVSAAAWVLSATKPNTCSPTCSASGGCPACAPARRYRSTSGPNWRGSPPMIATISGSPSSPARAKDSGEPPTPTQIGSGSCSGRG